MKKASEDKSLFDAVKHDDELLVRQLLQAGASPNDRQHDGQTALMIAARKGNCGILRILLDSGAHPDPEALVLAAFENHPRAVRILLDAGISPSIQIEGRPLVEALDWAGFKHDEQLAVRQLLEKAGTRTAD